MNKKFFRIALLCALLGTGAAVTSCTDYDQEIADLQDSVSALEKKVSDIQAAINAGEVVTSVEKTANGIVVKTNKGSYEINNGKNGAPGTVVTIGENGNWFLDGKDTGVAAKGDKGEQGQNGTNGTNGQDAEVKPEIKDGHLFINGVDCGVIAPKAIVAVVNGNTLTLTNVEGSMEPIVLNLKGGLTALVYRPDAVPADDMKSLALVSSNNVLATRPGTLTFKVFPAVFDVENAKFFFSDSYKSAEAPVQYVDGSAELSEGILSVNFFTNNVKTEQGNWHTSLDVEINGTTTSSDYFVVSPNEILDVKDGYLKAKVNTANGTFGSKNFAESYAFQYNKSLALADSAVTFVNSRLIDNYFEGVEYTLSVDNTLPANAEKVLSIVDNKVVVNAEDWKGTAAVGKTGVVTVTSSVKGVKVASTNLQVNVVLKKSEPVVVTADTLSVNYVDVVKGKTSTVKLALSEILNAVEDGISKNELMANFGVDTDEAHTTYDVEGTNYTDLDVVFESDKDSLAFTIKSGKKLPENYKGAVKLTWEANDQNSSITVVFPYVISYTATLPEFNPVVVKDSTIYSHKNVEDNRSVSLSDIFKENIELGELKLSLPMSHVYNAEITNPTITLKGNDGYLRFNGAFTGVAETVPVNGTLVLPNGSQHQFPGFLKAEFASLYTSTKFADIKLTADEKQADSVILGSNFTIKHGEETVFDLSTIVENKDIKDALKDVDDAAAELAEAQDKVDSLTAALAKFNDTLAVATADSLAKLAKIDSLNKADYMVEMPTFANLAEFAKSKEWNGLGKSYEWIKCTMNTTGHTGHYGDFFYFELNENGYATTVHIDMTQAEMNELWNQYKATAAIHNATAFENNLKLYNQTVIIAKDVHASDSIATAAKANLTSTQNALETANGVVESKQTALDNATEAYQTALNTVVWSDGHVGSKIEFSVKKSDHENAMKYGNLMAPVSSVGDYYRLREGAKVTWKADEEKSRIKDLVIPVSVVVTVKEGTLTGYVVMDTFNITLTSTLSK